MKYIYVLNKEDLTPKEDNILPSVLMHTRELLLSLRVLFQKKSVAYQEMDIFVGNLERFRGRYQESHALWIDSGGYSFIKGKYAVTDLSDMILWYTRFATEHSGLFDRIFSLDLPFTKKDKNYNRDAEAIYEVNLEATQESIEVFEQQSDLQSKYVYVYQFLQPKVYPIWRKIYSDLGLSAFIKRRAIGGIVGSRGARRNVPCPVIPIYYRCLTDFLNGQEDNPTNTFALHVLGMSLIQDRFAILFLQELTTRSPNVKEVDITYDTTRYARKVKLNHLWEDVFLPGNGSKYQYFPNIDDFNVAPDIPASFLESHECLLKRVYHPEHVETAREILDRSFEKRQKKLKADLERKLQKEQGKKDERPSAQLPFFDPVGVLSNITKDNIMLDAMSEFGLVDKFLAAKNESEIKQIATDFIFDASCCNVSDQDLKKDADRLARADLFSNLHFLWSVRRNIILTYQFHHWFHERRDNEKKLDKMIKKFVKDFHDTKKKW